MFAYTRKKKRKKLTSFYSSTATRTLQKSNVHRSCSQDTLAQSLAKVSAIIITVCTQSAPCVELQAFAILRGNSGNLAPTLLEDRTVQIYSVNIPPAPYNIFIGGTRQDAGVRRQDVPASDWSIRRRDSISQRLLAFQFHWGFSDWRNGYREKKPIKTPCEDKLIFPKQFGGTLDKIETCSAVK